MGIIHQIFICLDHLTHRHDIHSQFPAVQRSSLAVHPTEFLKLQAESVIVNFPLLIPQQRIGIDGEIQITERFEEDEMIIVFIHHLAELIHDVWHKILVAIFLHQLLIFFVIAVR